MRECITLRENVFLPHGYDQDVHRSLALDASDVRMYGSDVSLIATFSPFKEEALQELVAVRPDIDLRIWRNQWSERCRSPILKKCIQGVPLVGSSYARAIRATRINLAVMGIQTGAKDETSTRTHEIPACGGFMLHERTNEVVSLFGEGKEMACFGSIQELAEKVDYYLAHPEERDAIARAGCSRCVPAYSYDTRMAKLIKWHEERVAGRSPG
jgi:spore maturation protein CgeB